MTCIFTGLFLIYLIFTNKKDMKNINGIYSSRFGQKLGDVNPYADRYSCECGYVKARINHGFECPICHTKVEFKDANIEFTGWISLGDNYIINPYYYNRLCDCIGKQVVPDIVNTKTIVTINVWNWISFKRIFYLTC